MKNIIILIGVLFSVNCYSQRILATLTVPAVGHDTMTCFTTSPFYGDVQIVDYSDIDSTVYLKVGVDDGDWKPCWKSIPIADSIILSPYVDVRNNDGNRTIRKCFDMDYKKVCYRIYNVAASPDSTIYITK